MTEKCPPLSLSSSLTSRIWINGKGSPMLQVTEQALLTKSIAAWSRSLQGPKWSWPPCFGRMIWLPPGSWRAKWVCTHGSWPFTIGEENIWSPSFHSLQRQQLHQAQNASFSLITSKTSYDFFLKSWTSRKSTLIKIRYWLKLLRSQDFYKKISP